MPWPLARRAQSSNCCWNSRVGRLGGVNEVGADSHRAALPELFVSQHQIGIDPVTFINAGRPRCRVALHGDSKPLGALANSDARCLLQERTLESGHKVMFQDDPCWLALAVFEDLHPFPGGWGLTIDAAALEGAAIERAH